MAQAINIEGNAPDEMAMQREIDIMLAKIEQGLVDMKSRRESDDAQWQRIELLSERSRTVNAETQAILTQLRAGI